MSFPKPTKRIKAHKYGAQRTIIDGQEFPSKLEADTWAALRMQERMGVIRNLKRYPAQVEYVVVKKATLDFAFENSQGEFIHADAKGFETPEWKQLVKFWKKSGPTPLEVYKRNGRGIYLAEKIIPGSK